MTTLEDLTKTQIILLTILVSFVTSIAVGIVTASLLAQAPASVTQTINRVIEQTLPTNMPTPVASSTIMHEVTVVKEDDAITSAIAAALPALVRIEGQLASSGRAGFAGLGTFVSPDGLIISTVADLELGTSYSAVLPDGATLPLKVASTDETNGLILWKIVPDAAHKSFKFVSIAGESPKLGSTVFSIGGANASSASVGRVVSLGAAVTTDIVGKTEVSGSPLIDLSGELVGLMIPAADLSIPAGTYLPASAIRTLIANTK